MKVVNRVIFNTAVLYGRMLFTVGISFYTTRLLLKALGVIDYGIFSLTAGIIALLAFLNNGMATSTQRFLSYHLGEDDAVLQNKIFANSLFLHFILAVIIITLLQVVSFFLFEGFLNIPEERINDARVVYNYISVTVFFTILSAPFIGSLIAHENMVWIALINIVEASLKLGIGFYLLYISNNQLIVYSILTALISLFSFTLNALYCFVRYKECSFSPLLIEKSLIYKLSSFAGWSLFGSLCWLGRTQGLAVILNLFFGAVINAAFGIANQITGQLIFFSSTLLRAVNPQIMKSEGINDRERMLRLSMMASKFCFFLFAMFSVPCIFEMELLLQFWLGEIPDFTVLFCQLALLSTLIGQLTIGLQSAAQAIGRIKYYQITIGSLVLFNLPLSYFLMSAGLSPYSVLISFAFIELLACFVRIYFIKRLGGLSIQVFCNRVLLKEVIPLFSLILVSYLVVNIIDVFFLRFLITGLFSAPVFVLSIYLTGLCDDEKVLLNNLVSKIYSFIKEPKNIVSINGLFR